MLHDSLCYCRAGASHSSLHRVMDAGCPSTARCLCGLCIINTNTVKCLLSRRVLTISVCACVNF